MLHVQHFVHGFDAEATLAVEKIGDVGLFKAGLIGQSQARQIAIPDPLKQGLSEVVLKAFEFHALSIANSYMRTGYVCE